MKLISEELKIKLNVLIKFIAKVYSYIFEKLLMDFFFDIRYGTDTWGSRCPEDLIQYDNIKDVGYNQSRTRYIWKLLNNLNLDSNCVFVDVGSGKGKVLLIASNFKFKKIIGIESSKILCDIAMKNVSIYKTKVDGLVNKIEIINQNIVNYKITPEENVFFMFNPFNFSVMEHFLVKLKNSFFASPRLIWLIYFNPKYKNLIESQKWFDLYSNNWYGGWECSVFKSCDYPNSVYSKT